MLSKVVTANDANINHNEERDSKCLDDEEAEQKITLRGRNRNWQTLLLNAITSHHAKSMFLMVNVKPSIFNLIPLSTSPVSIRKEFKWL